MYTLCSKITIEDIFFESITDVKIERSIHKLGAKATIKMPITALLKTSSKPIAEMVEVAEQVNVGDKVAIYLGYNGDLKLEFVGYIKQKNYTQPLELICEDECYTTRNRNVSLSGTQTLEACLKACGLSVRYAVSLTLKNFVVDNKSAVWVLGKLQSDYGLHIFFDMDGHVIASRAYGLSSSRVKYQLRNNVICDDELKYQLASDVPLKIKAICFLKDGTKEEGEIGIEGGAQKTLYFYDVESKEELKALAQQELERYSYDGYEGKLTTFLQPYAEPCMLAELVDEQYSDRNGIYFIEAVEVSFGLSGARRIVEIGIKSN